MIDQVGHWIKQGYCVQWRSTPEDPGRLILKSCPSSWSYWKSPTIDWTDRLISTSPSQDAEVYDQGEYICVAENRVGRVDAAANIVVVPDPNNRRFACI